MRAIVAPIESPWFWTLAYGYHHDRRPTHGYAATRNGLEWTGRFPLIAQAALALRAGRSLDWLKNEELGSTGRKAGSGGGLGQQETAMTDDSLPDDRPNCSRCDAS
jgi:hypothetical protein